MRDIISRLLLLLGPTLASAADPSTGQFHADGVIKDHDSVEPVVELPYATYKGAFNKTTGQNVFRGIRYGAPPLRKLRWQLPQPPQRMGSEVQPATTSHGRCPQSRRSLRYTKTAEVEALLAGQDLTGDEDCLFLDLYAPAHASGPLPVLVWIHGGGYGLETAAHFDFQTQIQTNGNSYLAISIEYRLGAFGFLSSAELAKYGVPNAGIHDIRFALKWVQQYIHLFGGDPGNVTVSGASSGAGAIMALATAQTDEKEAALFHRAIATSTYLPTQPKFDDARPELAYRRFAEQVGCSPDHLPAGQATVFACLQAADTLALQNASDHVSTQALYGQWEFIPVTDGKLIRELPSKALREAKALAGEEMITTNVANEGVYFTWQNISSQADFSRFLATTYAPYIRPENISAILFIYAQPFQSFLEANSKPARNATDPGFESAGLRAPFATTTSGYATGWQQAANNFYAEATFQCPGYWLANAYARNGKKAWRYQFSVPPAYHGFDIGTGTATDVLLAPTDQSTAGVNPVFRKAAQTIWGNYVTGRTPALTAQQVKALAGAEGGETADQIGAAAVGNWTQWKDSRGPLLNLNMSGGVLTETESSFDGGVTLEISSYKAESQGRSTLRADWDLVGAEAWEGGRGARCEFLADLGPWLSS